MEGPLELIGAVVLPALAVLALVLIPFLDRRPLVRVTQRTTAFGVAVLAGIGWAGLTLAAVAATPKPRAPVMIDYSAPTDWLQLSAEELAGIGYFRRENCSSCHTLGSGEPRSGPDLADTAIRRTAAWLIEHFKRPAEVVPGSSMPPIQLNDAQLNTLAAFLLKLNPRNAAALQSAPAFAVEGAMVYQRHTCGNCHEINGVGVKLGPPLNGLVRRRTTDWVEGHFQDPQKYSPGTIMPRYRFSPRELKTLTAYLFTLPD